MMSKETKTVTPVSKSKTQHVVSVKVDGREVRVLRGKPEASAVNKFHDSIGLDLAAFDQAIELPGDLANAESVTIELVIEPVPGPQ